MNHRDSIAPQSDAEPVSDLSSFVSESHIPRASESEQPMDVLLEFPNEGAPSTVSAEPDRIRPRPTFMPLAAAAVFAGAIAGAWWGGFIPLERATAQPRADVPGHPRELVASMEVRPSTRPPVASIAPTLAREDIVAPSSGTALFEHTREQYRPPERATSMARGTGGALEAPPRITPPRPSTDPIPAHPAVVANLAPRSTASEPTHGHVFEVPAAPAPASTAPTSVMRPVPEALPAVAARTEQNEIQRALGQYRSAYQALNAEAARAVWPSVDVRALARAFESLMSQELTFDTCQFDIVGAAATAQCQGSATYTPKVGSRAPKLEPRQWTFHLRKVDEAWKIQSAQTRR